MSYLSRAGELDAFKKEINLCQFLAAKGFQLDRRNSSRSSVIMKNGDGDKLVVARSTDGTWIYFNVHGNDSGTIIDFVQRDRVSLGEVRKRLRPWVGKSSGPQTELPAFVSELQPSSSDNAKVLTAWARAKPIGPGNRYLLRAC